MPELAAKGIISAATRPWGSPRDLRPKRGGKPAADKDCDIKRGCVHALRPSSQAGLLRFGPKIDREATDLQTSR
jgi:hypothetical protein